MTAPSGDPRVRRPQQHEGLLAELRTDALFPTFRDVLLFAAALGSHIGRRVPLTSASEPIRYETLREPAFADALVNMIAANEPPRDPEIMDHTRLAERIRIFEEYVNGGLEYLQEQINVRHQPADVVVIALTTEAFEHDGGAEAVSVDELLSGVNW
ncbi:DNA phosphorothioation-associated protein 4 [Actinocrinis puniceicyclus]|uniref:DNA phosphorothioation-associated protein 4 n=1 Tax=Actinocrinis puniceicyclus TaxID=977794 RepID=A0A8J8BDS9_9ACTN|nr:DNA phosphorothioation-associated protein 4 [Actinocrinis puniceicyclus]MBS2966562.1 DNA phosphorothioation-associated protein 4 [Actinocrinis puniceicyclus]